ncbi:MAG: hypothetical protein JXM70_30095 [Pirellulales bacterium]|nr:hypothetical protein [Pirellulales bacterium]
MKTTSTVIFLAAYFLAASLCRAAPDTVDRIRVVMPPNSDEIVKNIASILQHQITSRCEAKLITGDDAELTVKLSIEPGIGAEGFRISDDADGSIKITGNDRRGLLFGVGKFLRSSRYDQGGFTPSTWRGESVPKCSYRAAYLATHFRNFYEAAPIEEVVHYVESLGLWGYNTLVIHYPTWAFNGISDPAAREWLDRFKHVMRRAKSIGLAVGIIQGGAEGYKNSPKEFYKTKVPGEWRGNFGIGLCPSKPAALTYLHNMYSELLDDIKKDVELDCFISWPYDEGGCACKDCWPWGARGFINNSKWFAVEVRRRFPECKMIISTWGFENENDTNPDGEWIGLERELAKDESWADYILADGHNNYFPKYILTEGVPGNLPLVNFPEISMFDQTPWGGYGANPAPSHFEELWSRIKHIAVGGMPYSEGIYEDLNKAIIAGFYWEPDRKAEETVKEYAAFEFSPGATDAMLEVVRIFEKNHRRDRIGPSAIRAFELVEKAEKSITPQARTAWRWRIFYLRALIDKELFQHEGKREGEVMKKAFAELTDIYHAQGCWFKPPKIK